MKKTNAELKKDYNELVGEYNEQRDLLIESKKEAEEHKTLADKYITLLEADRVFLRDLMQHLTSKPMKLTDKDGNVQEAWTHNSPPIMYHFDRR